MTNPVMEELNKAKIVAWLRAQAKNYTIIADQLDGLETPCFPGMGPSLPKQVRMKRIPGGILRAKIVDCLKKNGGMRAARIAKEISENNGSVARSLHAGHGSVFRRNAYREWSIIPSEKIRLTPSGESPMVPASSDDDQSELKTNLTSQS